MAFKNKQKEREWKARWRKQNPEKHKASQDKYRKSEKGKISRKKTKRKTYLKLTYNLTLEQYDEMFEQQDGVCAICGGVNTDGKRLFVDHDHETNRIRGLLCRKCNTWVGIFEHKKFAKEVKKYLRDYK